MQGAGPCRGRAKLNMRHLALIPARKGSTGLPGKNMLPIGQVSLVQRAVSCARDSQCFEEIAVSSDWDEVLTSTAGVGVRAVTRPDSLCGGSVVIEEVVRHVLDWYQERVSDEPWDSVCVLNPTSPFREADDIRDAYKSFNSLHPQSVTSVHEIKPILMARVRRGRRLLYHEAQFQWRNRQRRKPLLAQNGAIYITSVPYFRETGKLVGEKGLIHMMPKERSLDIDDYMDYLAAQAWHEELERVKGKLPKVVYNVEPVPTEAPADSKP